MCLRLRLTTLVVLSFFVIFPTAAQAEKNDSLNPLIKLTLRPLLYLTNKSRQSTNKTKKRPPKKPEVTYNSRNKVIINLSAKVDAAFSATNMTVMKHRKEHQNWRGQASFNFYPDPNLQAKMVKSHDYFINLLLIARDEKGKQVYSKPVCIYFSRTSQIHLNELLNFNKEVKSIDVTCTSRIYRMPKRIK